VVVVSSSQTEELKETERRQKLCLKSSCTHHRFSACVLGVFVVRRFLHKKNRT
jgi:hypothetical protein